MKKSIMAVIAENSGKAMVMVQRHYSYLSGPVAARYNNDANLTMAVNISHQELPALFALDKEGVMNGWKHGELIAESGIKIEEIVGSCQGRGPESGLRISEGFHEAEGSWLPVSCDAAANWPTYSFDYIKDSMLDSYPAEWMNGQHPDLITSDTPESFKARVVGLIDQLLDKGGVRMITSHFEIIALTHSLYVEGKDLGSINEKFAPQKGGGVLVVRHEDGTVAAYDYDAGYNVL
jgi:hypothetical protein